jgi:hypothetical protein
MSTVRDTIILALNTGNQQAINSGDASTAVGGFFNRIAELMLIVAVPLAFIAILWAGYSLITGKGKPEAYKLTQSIIIQLATGFILLLGATLIVQWVYSFIT